MITIDVNLSKWKIRIDGHANFDEEGKDIVCSAVSILFYTACQTLEQFKDGLVVNKVSFTKGGGTIKVKPKPEWEHSIALVFMTICNGFGLVSAEYPDYVKLNVNE